MQASEGIFILYFAVTQNELFRALPDDRDHAGYIRLHNRLDEPQHYPTFS